MCIRDRAFGADAVEMEGAAVAQAAQANGVPFVILRAISDLADHQANVSFDQFEREAADVSAALVIEMCIRDSHYMVHSEEDLKRIANNLMQNC